jgi:hypothetical protein
LFWAIACEVKQAESLLADAEKLRRSKSNIPLLVDAPEH